MDAYTFIQKFGADEAELVARTAGTSLVYIKQLASRHRYPSRNLAMRLVSASAGRLDFASLMGAGCNQPNE